MNTIRWISSVISTIAIAGVLSVSSAAHAGLLGGGGLSGVGSIAGAGNIGGVVDSRHVDSGAGIAQHASDGLGAQSGLSRHSLSVDGAMNSTAQGQQILPGVPSNQNLESSASGDWTTTGSSDLADRGRAAEANLRGVAERQKNRLQGALVSDRKAGNGGETHARSGSRGQGSASVGVDASFSHGRDVN